MDKQERVMKLIIKLGNTGVLFSSLDYIMNQWFTQVHQVFKNLPPENVRLIIIFFFRVLL